MGREGQGWELGNVVGRSRSAWTRRHRTEGTWNPTHSTSASTHPPVYATSSLQRHDTQHREKEAAPFRAHVDAEGAPSQHNDRHGIEIDCGRLAFTSRKMPARHAVSDTGTLCTIWDGLEKSEYRPHTRPTHGSLHTESPTVREWNESPLRTSKGGLDPKRRRGAVERVVESREPVAVLSKPSKGSGARIDAEGVGPSQPNDRQDFEQSHSREDTAPTHLPMPSARLPPPAQTCQDSGVSRRAYRCANGYSRMGVGWDGKAKHR
ncbi:hypothetical protein DFP72DRAFT_163098 [Ephemerocybe angulata]|uniref:Uncharacterized protein n=1 Tax=Ephemerocybe angulata TaxID=980116 RepID=A0A8H6I7E7_9AGAR|nr:hypothetical protein DFP72DRAFT_163098 [Tulosesus angulatus]